MQSVRTLHGMFRKVESLILRTYFANQAQFCPDTRSKKSSGGPTRIIYVSVCV